MSRPVTERDFRRPEFLDAKVEDYEFREDGAVVRKDRWEQGIHLIRSVVGPGGREFEIRDVVAAVETLKGRWVDADPEEDPEVDVIDIRLSCGSVLAGCERTGPFTYNWAFGAIDFTSKDFGADVIEYQKIPDPAPQA